ncbi:MAG: aspartokinase [bacterium]|nr:MAG: aspartokinase [bacterium]
MLRIFKFGGALLKDTRGMHNMASIVEEFKCEPLVIVVSAIGKTTNALENLLRLSRQKQPQRLQDAYFVLKNEHVRLIRSLNLHDKSTLIHQIGQDFYNLWQVLEKLPNDPFFAYDSVVSFGELFSGHIAAYLFGEKNLPVKLTDARTLIVTDENFTSANVNWPYTEKAIEARVKPELHRGNIVLTQGFIAAGHKGNVTTLGREGSDFSAAIFAYVLQAEEVCIWKDVPGLMNCNPRVFSDAIKLAHVSYNEAIELAFYGASVIHPKTLQPLRKRNIPLKVCAFYAPETPPTLIDANEENDADVPKIILKEHQTLLSISSRDLSFMAEANLKTVFSTFSKYKLHINLMQNSAVSFSVCFDENRDKLDAVINSLREEFILKYNEGLQLLTIRHDNGKLLGKLTRGKQVFLSQKNRTTLQMLIRGKE